METKDNEQEEDVDITVALNSMGDNSEEEEKEEKPTGLMARRQ